LGCLMIVLALITGLCIVTHQLVEMVDG
jgi:hypothetical protein